MCALHECRATARAAEAQRAARQTERKRAAPDGVRSPNCGARLEARTAAAELPANGTMVKRSINTTQQELLLPIRSKHAFITSTLSPKICSFAVLCLLHILDFLANPCSISLVTNNRGIHLSSSARVESF